MATRATSDADIFNQIQGENRLDEIRHDSVLREFEHVVNGLRREIDQRHKNVEQRFDSLTRELDNERVTVNQRMEKMNEVRDQLREQAATFARREQLENIVVALQQEIEIERNARLSQQGAINTWKWIAGFLGMTGLGGLLLAILNASGVTGL